MAKLVRVNTRIEVVHYNYQWNIQNFEYSCKRPAGKAINSPIFAIPNTKINGSLKVYPGGISEQYKDYVSVYLDLKNYDEADLTCKFELYMPQSPRSDDSKSSGLKNFSLNESFGFPDYIRREYLLSSGILVDEELTLMCDISVSTGIMKTSREPDTNDEVISVESCLVKDFASLLEAQSHADVTFKIGNRHFKAHKVILMARSKRFKEMFTGQPNKEEFEMDDMSDFFMKHLLQYVYTGKVNIAEYLLMDFVAVLWRYGFNNSELQAKCEKVLFSEINCENAISMFSFAHGYGFDKLYENSLNYIVEHFLEIVHTEDYKNLLMSHSFPVSEIVKKVAENVPNNSLYKD